MKLTLGVFSGAIKALHEKLLPDSAGVDSQNQKPGRGDLRPWKVPLTAASVPAGRASIYRMGRDVRSDANYWLSWTTRVHAVRGYNAEDTTERTYYTGSGAPKYTDNTIALASTPYPTAYRDLGVPAPTTALILVASGGSSANTESRYYTHTFVTDKGEESAPGPASLELVCKEDDGVAISNIDAPPAGAFTIDRIRIYVTQSGLQGETEFFFLREVAAGTTSTTDDLRQRGGVLETTGWLTPPADLSCLTGMWNGMMAGISGKGVRVCVPFAPYAWPIENELLPADASPKGLGVWRQNLLVLTTGQPQLASGTSPEALDLQPVSGRACSSEPGIVSFEDGVAYPTEDGLAFFSDGGERLLTEGLLTRDDWQAMNPSGMVGGPYEGRYVGFYTDAGSVRRGFILDPRNPQGIFYLDTGYSALFFDKLQDALFVLKADGSVQKWDAGAAMMTATYHSKVFTVPQANIGWARVTADAYPVTLRVDAGPFTSTDLTRLVARNPAILSANGSYLRCSLTVANGRPFRLPGGFTATDWQLQVETQNPVQAVVLATSAEETK